jgi:hypothetical protein
MPRRKEESDSEEEEEVDLDEEEKVVVDKGKPKPDHKLRWVNWVKKWARDHDDMAYGCALANSLCSAEYREKYPKKVPENPKSFGEKTKKGKARHLKEQTQEFVTKQVIRRKALPIIKRNKELKEIDEARRAIPGMLADSKQERIHRIEEELEEKIDYIQTQGKMTLDKRKRIGALRAEAREKIKEINKIKARPNPIRRADRKPMGTAFGLKGMGMTSVSTGEDTNGLTHIYPLTHGQILKIAAR